MSTRIVPSYETYEFDAKKNVYCICVFVINEGEKLLNQLKTMSGICDGLVDIVLADGGSTDDSTDHDKLKALGVNTLLVKTGEGKLGSQMRMAFDWALNRGYEGVVVVDGNGKDGMDAIPRFVEELKKSVDHVQGSRFIKGGHHENTPKTRLWGLKLLHVPLMRLASGFKYTDTTNGFRAYSARLLSSDKLNIFRDCFAGYELHYYLAIEAVRQKFICSEIPVSRVYPASGKVPTKITGIKGNYNVIKKLFLSAIGFYRPKKDFSWNKYFKILTFALLSILVLNFLIYVGLGLYLKISSNEIIIATVRPCESQETISFFDKNENETTQKRSITFSLGKNKVVFGLANKKTSSSCDIVVKSESLLYCDDIIVIDSIISGKAIKSSTVKEEQSSEEKKYAIPTISDSRWKNGIGLKHNGFFLETNDDVSNIKKGDTIIIDSLEEHVVKNIRSSNKYTEIDVDAPIAIIDNNNSHVAMKKVRMETSFIFDLIKAEKEKPIVLIWSIALTVFELLAIVFSFALFLCFRFLIYEFFRIDEQKYINPDKGHRSFLQYTIISLILSILMTLILYPGIIYSDSMGRVGSGISLLSYNSKDYISTPQSIASILSYSFAMKWFGSIALVSIVQAFLHFLSICLICDLLNKKYRYVLISLMSVCPFVLGLSVYHETNEGAMVFLLLSVWLLFDRGIKRDYIHLVISIVLYVVCLLLMFNFRQNAIVLAPVFLGFSFILFMQKCFAHRRTTFILQVISVFVAINLSNNLTDRFVDNTYSFAQPGFLWKGISIVQDIPRNSFYENYFDYYSEIEDATSKALEKNQRRSFYGMISFFPTTGCKKERSEYLVKDLCYLFIFHPGTTIAFLWDDFLQLSGVPALAFAEYNFNRWSNGEFYHIQVDSFLRLAFFNRYCSFVKTAVVLLSPWILFVSCFALALILLFRKRGRIYLKENGIVLCFAFFAALVYNYAYMINAQNHEYRYSIPSLVFLLILNIALLCAFFESFVKEQWSLHVRNSMLFFVLIFFLFQLYYLLCENGNEIVSLSKSKPFALKDEQIKVFNRKNRLLFVVPKNFDCNFKFDITFIPDSSSSINTVKSTLDFSRLKSFFCGFRSDNKILYYDFNSYPVKSYVLKFPHSSNTLTITSKPVSVTFNLGVSPKSNYFEHSQISSTGLSYDRRSIFVTTSGTDFSNRYLELSSGRRIRILGSKWYQEGKILYLEKDILPNESISSNNVLQIFENESPDLDYAFSNLSKLIDKKGIATENKDIKYLLLQEENVLYFKLPLSVALQHVFFYHIRPLFETNLASNRVQYGFNNLDFKFSESMCVPKPSSVKSEFIILPIKLPNYPWRTISFGQYEQGTRFWTVNLSSNIPNERHFFVSNHTDENWTNGINDSDKSILLLSRDQVVFPNDFVHFPDGSFLSVIKTEEAGQYIHVFLEKDAPVFNPNQPLVLSPFKPRSVLIKEAEARIAEEKAKRETNPKESETITVDPSLLPMAVPAIDQQP